MLPTKTFCDKKQPYNIDFSVKGFLAFCKQNPLLVFVTAFVLFFIYSVKLANMTIGVDTELHLQTPFINSAQIGRYGMIFTKQLFWYSFGGIYNLHTVVFIAILLLFVATLLVCYLFDSFSGKRIKTAWYLPVAIYFASSPVWLEQIYFVLQCAGTMLQLVLSCIEVYTLFNGFINRKKSHMVLSVFLAVLITSIYQSGIVFLACAVFACFLFVKDDLPLSEKEQWLLCVKILCALAVSLVLYFVGDVFCMKFIFNVEKSSYAARDITVKNLIHTSYQVIFTGLKDDIKQILNVLLKEQKYELSGTPYRFSIFLVLVPFYTWYVIKNCKKSLLFVLAAIALVLCAFILNAITGSNIVRAMYPLPLALCAMFLFALQAIRRKTVCYLLIVAFAFAGILQTRTSAEVMYCDVINYQADVRFAQQLHGDIVDAVRDTPLIERISNGEQIKLMAFGGHYNEFGENFRRGELAVHSSFIEQDFCQEYFATRIPIFMRDLGLAQYVSPADFDKIEYLLIAKQMPCYPQKDSVQVIGDTVFVKLSESNIPPSKQFLINRLEFSEYEAERYFELGLNQP